VNLGHLWQRFAAAFAPGRIFATKDDGPMPLVQMRTGPDELIEDVPLILHYGFAMRPPADTLGFAVFIGGNRNQGVVVATNHPVHRLKNLEPGDAAIYDNRGRWIWLKDGKIEIQAAGDDVDVLGAANVKVVAATKVRIETPLTELTGNLTVEGSVTAQGTVTGTTDVVANGKSLKAHLHGGVTAGGASTGPNV